jgi:DNA polymerase V
MSSKTPPEINIVSSTVCAGTGFPSPADDYLETGVDWNRKLNANPPSTFTVRVLGDSMSPTILENDHVVVDKSLQPRHRDVVIAIVKGEFTLKRWMVRGDQCLLVPDNDGYPTIDMRREKDAEIWGVVTHMVRSFRPV